MMLPFIIREFPIDPQGLLPSITADSDPFWSALTQGRLEVQACLHCAKLRFPIAPVCPRCGETVFRWQQLSGRGTVFSWVRYHRSFLPEFEDLLPYTVVTAQLDEGVRMIGRLLERDVKLKSGMSLSTAIEKWPGGRCVPVFTCGS